MIAHVDMDSFYVSVEMLRHPELRGKPVVVAHDGPRGVVTTASYEARKFGVHSALPMVTARRRCPDLTVLPVDMQLYRRGSVKVMTTLQEFSDIVEVVGMDEAYVDLSASRVPRTRAPGDQGPDQGGDEARLLDRPGAEQADGEDRIGPRQARRLLRARRRLLAAEDRREAGVDPARGRARRPSSGCARIGIETVAQLANADLELLRQTFGANHGEGLRARGNGVGSSDLTTDRVRKSESRETTFPSDVTDRDELAETIERLADSVCESLAAHGSSGRTVTMKIRLKPFRTFTRSRTLPSPTRDPEVVKAVARELLERFDPPGPGAADRGRRGLARTVRPPAS